MELSYKPKDKAFSLLELIIMVAILSIGIIAILQAFSYAVRMTGLSCDMIKAVFLAEDKMQELEFNITQNLTSEEYIEDSGLENKFNWTCALNLNSDLNLYEADFDIIWQRANRREELSLNTYFKKPE